MIIAPVSYRSSGRRERLMRVTTTVRGTGHSDELSFKKGKIAVLRADGVDRK